MSRLTETTLSVSLALVLSCQRRDEEAPGAAVLDDDVLAMVEDETITLATLERELGSRPHAGISASREERARVLEELVDRKSLLVRAREAGFTEEPEIARLVETLIATRYRERLLEHDSEPEIATGQVRAFYDAHPERFAQPAAVRAGVLWIAVSPRATPAKRAERRTWAATLRDRAQDAGDPEFRSLVQRHSEDQASRYTGGDTGWLVEGGRRTERTAAIESAARGLEQPGEVAPLVELPEGFAVVRLAERRDPGPRPFDQVRDAIRYELAHAERQAAEAGFSRRLRDGLDIRIEHQRLEQLPSPPSPELTRGPPALPGD